jgi:hypothetical protein
MSATVWLVLTATGFGLLRALPMVGHDLLKSVLVRVAAFAFIGAGVIGASGWIGSWFQAAVGWINTQGSAAMLAAIGTGAVWVLWLGLSIIWLLAVLPHGWFAFHMPDWLSVTGLALPALAASIPGPVGDFFQTVNKDIGNLMIHAASSAIGAA